MAQKTFLREVIPIAVPVALESLLQSSFSMVDQIMVGQLGDKTIAAVEIAGKQSFIYAFVLGAIASIAGIMLSQYIGKNDRAAEEKSICINLLVGVTVGAIFFVIATGFAHPFVRLFSNDAVVIREGSAYLGRIGWAYLPMGISELLAVCIRCRGKSSWPLYVGMVSASLNTFVNYILIFGHFGAPALGVVGAAYASILSQAVSAMVMIVLFFRMYGKIRFSIHLGKEGYMQYLAMLCPVVINEFLWTVGQSINTYVYGHLSTDELAGMALTGSVQGLTIGALSGLSQAAGILIGKRLGEGEYDRAYKESKKLCLYGFVGSICLSALLILLRSPYVGIYKVSDEVKTIGAQLLIAFAVLMPVKVQNMILGGGIIRSGGKTKLVMMIDMLGTWLVNVPLALLTGLVWRLPIVWVYFILSQEELVRLAITVYLFRTRRWMNTIK